MARRMGYLALTIAGTWKPTTTPNTQSSSVSHGQSADLPALLVGIRKYASSNAEIDSVIRSSRNSPSVQTCRRDEGMGGVTVVIVCTPPRAVAGLPCAPRPHGTESRRPPRRVRDHAHPRSSATYSTTRRRRAAGDVPGCRYSGTEDLPPLALEVLRGHEAAGDQVRQLGHLRDRVDEEGCPPILDHLRGFSRQQVGVLAA